MRKKSRSSHESEDLEDSVVDSCASDNSCSNGSSRCSTSSDNSSSSSECEAGVKRIKISAPEPKIIQNFYTSQVPEKKPDCPPPKCPVKRSKKRKISEILKLKSKR